MGSGIRAEVKINTPDMCPIAEISGQTDTPCYTISKSIPTEVPGTVAEEFILDDRESFEESELEFDESIGDVELTEVFSYGSKRVYRFSRPPGWGCPCECVEQFGCPVIDVHTQDGDLYLAFHTPDIEVLEEVVRTLRDRFPETSVQRLLRSNEEQSEDSFVFVDRTVLTDRQQEVLETAHQLGYFNHPKSANAGEVAEALGITTSTFTEHLAAAQRKLLSTILSS